MFVNAYVQDAIKAVLVYPSPCKISTTLLMTLYGSLYISPHVGPHSKRKKKSQKSLKYYLKQYNWHICIYKIDMHHRVVSIFGVHLAPCDSLCVWGSLLLEVKSVLFTITRPISLAQSHFLSFPLTSSGQAYVISNKYSYLNLRNTCL